MENIITEVTTIALRGDLLERLSSQIHESASATRRGVEQAVPVSVVGLAVHVSSEQRAEELLGAFRGRTYPQMDPSAVARTAVDPEATWRLAQSSSGFLDRIFGNKLDAVLDMLAGNSGVSKDSAATLLGLATPMVLDAVGKEAEARKLDARGLTRFLADQGQKASGALPGPLTGAIGVGPAGGARMQSTAQRARAGTGDVRQRGRGVVDAARERGARGAARATEAVREPQRSRRVGLWLAVGLILLMLVFLLFARRGRGPEAPAGDAQTSDLRIPIITSLPGAQLRTRQASRDRSGSPDAGLIGSRSVNVVPTPTSL